jgi:pimeloyl-ACP methyl ester carboxylesterase
VNRENLETRSLELGDEVKLVGEAIGEGSPVVLCHGLTATRRQVVHGSMALPRAGHEVISYDARGHGDSDPAPPGSGYGYPQMIADLEAVVAQTVGEDRFVLAGHSMGSHTAVGYALEHPQRIAGLVMIGPVYMGGLDADAVAEGLARWDALADGLDQGGIDGFLEVIDRNLDPRWRESVLRFTRQRMEAHRHLDAVAQALREVPRSKPLESMDELEFLDLPVLVVASHDVADPGHPFAVAEAYAERLPRSRLISEAEGESPLAWQGGRLSREIAAFADESPVIDRLGAGA